MSHRVSARIVIGMPVYNAEATLSDAIASVLLYPGHDLKLVISDNASTDDTLQICQRFAASDSRVVVVAQSQNIGAVANFDYVLSVADSNFFMWAAADDVRSPHFLDRCVAFLEEHDDYVGVTCPVRFNGGSFEPASMGDASIEQNDPYERMLMFFDGLHANGRFYSLFRRNALKDGFGQKNEYLGADWTLVIRALQKGKLKRLDSGYMDRGTGGASDKPTIFSHYRNVW
jgi:glycosyltransferase involved in cell wall biosynthesis